MPVPYRTDLVLGPATLADRPAELARVNDVLTAAGLGPAVQPPVAVRAGYAVLPVAGADPAEIRAALRRAGARDPAAELPDLAPDYQYRVDTVGRDGGDTRVWYASGQRIGHGAFGWLSAPAHEMPDRAPGRGGRQPVVALLDTAVVAHDWLPTAPPEPLWVDATADGWEPCVPVPEWSPGAADPDRMDYGPYFGHGTFLAGIIWAAAPAQVLSLPVMSEAGEVSIANVGHALAWLADRVAAGARLDAVLLAFGRQPDATGDADDSASDGDADSAGGDGGGGGGGRGAAGDRAADDRGRPVREALARLSGAGVPVVVSVGNGGSDRPAYPAAYATDPELSTVVSVGSQVSPTRRAPYSNHGVWVTGWRYGSDVVSLMPLSTGETGRDGYAWWSGTSFAAARYVAGLVAPPDGAGAGR